MDNKISEEIPTLRETQIPPNYSQQHFEGCLKLREEKGINVDVALTTEDVKGTEHQSNAANKESLKTGLKIHEGKTKCMTNIDTTDNIQIDWTEIEKATNYKYLGQTIAMENRTKQEVSIRIKAGWSAFGKYRELFLDRHLPMGLKRKVFNQRTLPAVTYGCQTWSLTKAFLKKLTKKQSDRHSPIVSSTKWKWAGHITRMKYNRWTIRST